MHEITLSEPRMNWDDGRLFLAVARAGQMLAAARTLGVNQATLSRRMAALEAAVGTKLLVRRTHGTDLTAAGLALLEVLERVEQELVGSQGMMQLAGSAVAGVVRIGAPDGFGVAFLSPLLGAFAERHPSLRLQIVPTPRTFSLARREADIAIMVGRPERGRLVTRKLTDYTLGLYGSRQYLAGNGVPASSADLGRHRLIGYVDDLIPAAGLNYAGEFLRNWRSHFEVSSAIGQVEAVRTGAGIGVLHDYIARADPELVRVLPSQRAIRSYWVVVHESLRDVPRVRAASDFLVEAARRAQSDFVAPA